MDDDIGFVMVLALIAAGAFLVLRQRQQEPQIIVMPNKGDPLGSLLGKALPFLL